MTPLRFTTLLGIAFVQYAMRYLVILPVMRSQSIELLLSDLAFLCLVLSTICIATAGFIKETKRITTNIIFAAAGLLLGAYAVTNAGFPNLILTCVAITIMALTYQFAYRQQFLVGNIIVALFFALVPMMTLLDLLPVIIFHGRWDLNLDLAVFWISGTSLFIFLSVLSCEIMKDTEDFENDNVTCDTRSFPFVMGATYAKWTIIGINTTVIALLVLLYCLFFRYIIGWLSFFYILLLLIVPITYINIKIHKAVVGVDYRHAAKIMKLVMLAGICYSGLLIIAQSCCK